jgi:hypothetical protein
VLSIFVNSRPSSALPRMRLRTPLPPRSRSAGAGALLTLTLLTAGGPTLAQPASAGLAVADPAHPTPALVYRSAFDAPALQTDPAPGNWAALNARVGQFKRGHLDILRQEELASTAHPAPGGAPATPQGGTR